MAIRLPITCITKEQIQIINRDLTIIKKPKFFGNRFIKTVDPPIFQYKLTTDYYIYLPFFYGCCLCKSFVNNNNIYQQVNIKFNKPLYESQKIVADKAIDVLNRKASVILNLYTGWGKTILGSYLSIKIGLLTLIIMANTVLIDQWIFTYKDFTDAKIWVVGDEKQPEEFNVILSMVERLEKIPKDILYRVGTLIIDEAHTFCTPTRTQVLLEIFPKYVIALTATLDREDNLELIMENICGLERIIEKSVKPFIVYKFNTGIEFETPKNRAGVPDWNKHIDIIFNDPIRNGLILGLAKDSFKNEKVLILTWRVENAINICDWLKYYGESVDYMAGDKKTYHDSRILVGTISKIGTGFDQRAACPDFDGIRLSVLIMVGSIKSSLLLEQVIGRVTRSEIPKIIYLSDDNDLSIKHWKVLNKWCKDRNCNIFEWNGPNVKNQVVESISSENIVDLQYQNYMNNKNKK